MPSLLDRMNSCYCRSYVSQHYEGWETRMFERYDIDNYLKTLDDQGADAVIVTARTFTGYWYTDLGFGTMMPGLNGVDQLQEAIEYFRKKNKMIIAYFTVVFDKDQYDLHPDWRQLDREGNPLATGQMKIVCMNSPYREYIKYMIRTMFEQRDIDGMLLDMPFFSDKICHCENCKRKFKAHYKTEVPENDDYSDPNFRNYVRFRRKSNETFIREIFDEVRSVKKDVVLYPQYQLLKGSPRSSQNLEIPKHSDFIYTDVYFERGYLPISAVTKISTTVCKNMPEIGFMTRPGTHNDAPNMKPIDQIRYESFTVLANGGAVHYHDIMWPDGTLQKEMWDRHAVVFDEIKLRKPWLKGEKMAQVAVYYSEENAVWFGQDNRIEHVESHLYGAFRALTEAKIDYDIITDVDQKTLTKYDTLLLPNVGCMSPSELSSITAYVENGGGLVASAHTSLYDEEGRALNEFQLAELFGVSRIDDTGSYSRVYNKYETDSAIGMNTCEDGMMTSWGVSQKVELTTGKAVASRVYPYTEPTEDRFINSMANPPAVYTREPACVINQFGRGKVVYFTDEIEKNYLITSFHELREIIKNAVFYTLAHPLMVEVINDALIEVVTYKSENRIYIHLVNGQANKGISFSRGKPPIGKRAQTSPSYIETREIIHKVIPTYHTKIVLKSTAVKEAILAPKGEQLEFAQQGSDFVIEVPKIEYHDIVEIVL